MNRTDHPQIQVSHVELYHLIFYLQKHEILFKSGFSDVDFPCKTDDFSQNRVSDDNLNIFCVQSDCTGVKMCDNTFSHGFKRDCVVIEDVRAPK